MVNDIFDVFFNTVCEYYIGFFVFIREIVVEFFLLLLRVYGV